MFVACIALLCHGKGFRHPARRSDLDMFLHAGWFSSSRSPPRLQQPFQSLWEDWARSAVKLRHAARSASWADSMKMTAERHPEVARVIIRAKHEVPSIQAVVTSQQSLVAAGFACPGWDGAIDPSPQGDEDPNQPRDVWQLKAANEIELRCFSGVLDSLPDPQQVVLR